jgi:hypothetical protein
MQPNIGGHADGKPAVGPVRFALWTLRDEAAQRRAPGTFLSVRFLKLATSAQGT